MSSDTNPIKQLANQLREHNLWRRGKGKYAYTGDPRTEAPMPLSPRELTEVLEKAIAILDALADGRKINTEEMFSK